MIKFTGAHASLISLLVTTAAHSSIDQTKLLNTYESTLAQRCLDPTVQSEKLCDTSADKSSPVFHSKPILPDTIQIDIRPENCQSFFNDYLHTRRGLRIESALRAHEFYENYTNTVFNFPVVDFISNGHIRVVKTRDLMTDSFNNSADNDSLFEQILDDAADIHERFLRKLQLENKISATSNGVTSSVAVEDVQYVTLDIVIQSGMATENQIDQIKRAKEVLQDQWGFDLQIIEIP